MNFVKNLSNTAKSIFIAIFVVGAAAILGLTRAGGYTEVVQVEGSQAVGSGVLKCQEEGGEGYLQLGGTNSDCGKDPEATTQGQEPSTGDDSQPAGVETIEGIITRIDRESDHALILENGEVVEEDGPVVADGGWAVTVDGKKIQTTSGFVPQEEAFSVDVTNFSPGDRVLILAEPTGFADNYTLNCATCKIELNP